ncbi:LLM class flavin-dependent oxidoreductase [Solirubrobacter soli]|uniref:LLM class flavin-dependent oxidoreductase n=1 Tax=Solirubrobacter soli TaxID=363832 RepID=UPI00040CAE2F|nr:LLM class flavin-dependent oxidoreductase [Solirubrobacter soli]
MSSFGLVLPIQARGVSLGSLIGELGEEVLAAEAAGFEAVYLPEFHQAHGGALVSPLLLLGWLGARTSTIRLGTLVAAAPLYDPVRLAEDALMLDHATGGRLILGLGSAHVDFELFGRDRSRRQALFDEVLDVLDAAFSGEPFEVHGRRGQVTAGGRRPTIWIGAHGPRGLRRAAERADGWVCDPQRGIDAAARLAARYRAALPGAATPHDSSPRGHVALFREAWIGDLDEWAPHAMKVHRLYFNVGTYLREFEPWVDEIRSREDFTFERVAPDRFLVGDGEEIRATVADWVARTGADHIAIRLRQPTGPSHEATLAAIERFGREVISGARTPGAAPTP